MLKLICRFEIRMPIKFLLAILLLATCKFSYAQDPQLPPVIRHGKYFLQRPNVPYPWKAKEAGVTGAVTVVITARNGAITNAHASGKYLLAYPTEQWIKTNWIPAPGINAVFTVPTEFVM
jgi:hypothetical protein